jgi:hypothetical protein
MRSMAESSGLVILRLEVVSADRQPVSGLVRDGDGAVYAFSGWSELFAVLFRLVSGPSDGADAAD